MLILSVFSQGLALVLGKIFNYVAFSSLIMLCLEKNQSEKPLVGKRKQSDQAQRHLYFTGKGHT